MNINKTALERAAAQVPLSPTQTEALWQALLAQPGTGHAQILAKLAYYLGGLILLAAMSWFLSQAWAWFGSYGLLNIVGLYMLSLGGLGVLLWFKAQRVAGGIILTIVVSMTPLLVYAVIDIAELWVHDVSAAMSSGNFHTLHGNWLILELSTALVCLIALRFFRFALLIFPLGLALWFVSLDGAAWWLNVEELGLRQQFGISAGYGLVALSVAYGYERMGYTDLAFSWYLLGLSAFWGGLSGLYLYYAIPQWVYLVVNVGLMFAGVWLQRRLLLVFGSIGVLGYLTYLLFHVFAGSMLFPFVLTGLGVLVIIVGVFYQRHLQTRLLAER